jgi:hypothetical protein
MLGRPGQHSLGVSASGRDNFALFANGDSCHLCMLIRREPYVDLGSNYFDELQGDRVCDRLTRRLEALGYTVRLEAAV